MNGRADVGKRSRTAMKVISDGAQQYRLYNHEQQLNPLKMILQVGNVHVVRPTKLFEESVSATPAVF